MDEVRVCLEINWIVWIWSILMKCFVFVGFVFIVVVIGVVFVFVVDLL